VAPVIVHGKERRCSIRDVLYRLLALNNLAARDAVKRQGICRRVAARLPTVFTTVSAYQTATRGRARTLLPPRTLFPAAMSSDHPGHTHFRGGEIGEKGVFKPSCRIPFTFRFIDSGMFVKIFKK
jgi:hypothetical protein